MEEPLIEIPRRVDWIDFVIIVAVVLMVAIDLALIRDPLHTLLGILMIPAGVRVVRGFRSLTVYPDRVECGGLRGLRTYALDGPVSVRKQKALGTTGVLQVRVDGEHRCTVGHTATPDELLEIERTLLG